MPRLSNEEYIERVKKLHNNKYIYDKCEYTVLAAKVTITCPIHGDFRQRAKAHSLGQGCPKCGGRFRTTEEFIRLANAKHNNSYYYMHTVYTKAINKVTITCPIHGDFNQKANDHLRGHGCPECAKQLRKIKSL